MSRAIQLTKIHALNWYGYRDSLPIKGNLVLAGVTGSGKSILMDLLMLILVGPNRAKHHFNRSATGGKSDRTIKSYCLLDTKREENGQPEYFHHKGVTTYIGAEFTWPDGKRVETWGLRLEYNGTAEHEGVITPYFYPGSLEKDDFLTISEEDGKTYTSNLSQFKQLIDSKQGQLYTAARDYLRDMSNPSHLNFNQDVIQRLLPSAMSFTNLKSFDDFCRQFVLPNEEIPVEDVISSFRDFESYERELRELRAQLDRLLRIRNLAEKQKEAIRNQKVAHYLSLEHSLKHAIEDLRHIETQVERLRQENANDEARVTKIAELKNESQQTRETKLTLLNESEEGRLYQDLARRIKSIEQQIEKLRAIATRIDHGLTKRIQSAQNWLKEITSAPLEPAVNTSEMQSSIKLLESCAQEETATTLAHMASAADQLCQNIRDRFRQHAHELRSLRDEQSKLKQDIKLLDDGLPPVAQPLLDALQKQLPTLPGETPPRAMRELCEIENEHWRAAAEVIFQEKFTVLVSADHYQQGLEILDNIPAEDIKKSGPQYLLDASVLLAEKKQTPKKGSLAKVFSCSDPAAEHYINQQFGSMICVNDTSELLDHDTAITVNGIFKQNSKITRSTAYDDKPFIGETGLKKQLQIKRSRLSDIETRLRQLEPIEADVHRLIQLRSETVPNHSEISAELVRVEQLPQLEKEHEDLMTDLQSISTNEFDDLRVQIEELDKQIKSYETERTSILRKGGLNELKRAEAQLKHFHEEKNKRENAFLIHQKENDIHAHYDYYVKWDKELTEQYPKHDVLRSKFKEAADAAERFIIESKGELKLSMADFKLTFKPKFDDLPDDGTDTAPYDQILSNIEDADIPKYEKKSETERTRWESLFRTQVLSRMQQALKKVENIIALLNIQLKQPIGNDRYKIDKIPNPDFKIYRQLIDMNALHHEDELFYGNMDAQMKDALEEFLQTLTKNNNSPEAARLLDYRQYFDYDLLVTDIRDSKLKPVSVDKQSGKMSGGENQSPYFVAILASYLHAYNRHETRRKEPSLALVPIDEAFSKLSGERIQSCIKAMTQLDLQGIFSMSSGNIPYAFSQCDELIIISRKDEKRGNRIGVRNVPVVLLRNSPEGEKWMRKNDLESSS